MFKTIFGKLFLTYVIILAVSLGALCVVLISFYSNQVIDERSGRLEEQAKRLSDICASSYSRNLNALMIDDITLNRLANELAGFRNYLNTSSFFTNSNFTVIMASSDISDSVMHEIVPSALIEKAEPGLSIVLMGDIDGFLPYDGLTVCYPVEAGGSVIAMVFVSMPMSEIVESIAGIYRVTLSCILLTAVVSFALIYWISKSISNPIKKINEAAQFIASGNFDRRIEYGSKDEIGQLSRSFNDMAESLDNQENKRRDFIANISHDLRSPLTSMKGFLQAVIDGTIPPERQNHYLNIVYEESERLTRLANDVLDLNKVSTLNFGINQNVFDVNELIRKTVIMFEREITGKNIEMSVIFQHETTMVTADYEKIQRVVYNLIDNAVKFVDDKGGKIIIETAEKIGKACVMVRDNGRGISPDDQRLIFDRLYKIDQSRGEDKKGSGLGLSIVKEFMHAHGESITVRSELGKGSEFMFTLTLNK